MRILSIFALMLLPNFAIANGIGGVVDSPAAASLMPASTDGQSIPVTGQVVVVDSQDLTKAVTMTMTQNSVIQPALTTLQPK